MSGITGLMDLSGGRREPQAILPRMMRALGHRGADGESRLMQPGVGLGWLHLHPTGSPGTPEFAQGGEHQSIVVICQGRPTNMAELWAEIGRARLQPPTASAAELLAHLWARHGERSIEMLRGAFAFALWDGQRRSLYLGRDRFGCMPLFWAMHEGWLLFGSEIKAILAGGLPARADRLGIDHAFTFIGMPGPRTCFEGVQALQPGHWLLASEQGTPSPRRYWDLDFPDRGQEVEGNLDQMTDQLEELLLRAVSRRVHPGERITSGISGGIDCSTLVALAGKVRGEPLPTFTLRIESPKLDEVARAQMAGRASGSEPTVISCTRRELVDVFPQVIRAAESPVSDPSCGALLRLAQRARAEGYTQILSGDGSDDLFAGYPWFRIHRMLGMFDWIPGVRPSQWLRRAFLRVVASHAPWAEIQQAQKLIGGHHPWLDLYGMVISTSRSLFYSAEMKRTLNGRLAFEDLDLNLDRMRRWHPLNQGLYMGMKVHLVGLQVQGKGDRAAMSSGVQPHLPFLDEEVVQFTTRIAPHYKLRRLRDKYLLRRVAERWLPGAIAWRPKKDFVAPFDSLYETGAQPWTEQLLSEESLRRAGYFDPEAVKHWRQQYPRMGQDGTARLSMEIGLSAVVATQLWHHTFIDGNLADMPGRQELLS